MKLAQRFQLTNFDCILPPDVRAELLGRANGVLAPKPVRSGLVLIGSWLTLTLLVAVGIVGGLNSSSHEPATNKRVSLPVVPTVPRAELVSLPAPRAELVRLPVPRAELVWLNP